MVENILPMFIIHSLRGVLGLFIGLTLLVPGRVMAQTKEYEIKAVFLYNFARFVEWPTNAFATTNAPLVIGVLGQDPFGSYLDKTVEHETVNDRPLVVRRYERVEEVRDCHILFISSSEKGRLQQTLTGLQHRGILTVGEMEGFASQGGVLRFLTEDNKIKLRINLAAARTEHLTISSQLLKLAEIVRSGKD